jgi:hypothetical protein
MAPLPRRPDIPFACDFALALRLSQSHNEGGEKYNMALQRKSISSYPVEKTSSIRFLDVAESPRPLAFMLRRSTSRPG